MENLKKMFSEDVKVPEIVLQEADAAFAKIKMEGNGNMANNRNRNGNKRNGKVRVWKGQAAAAVCACILVAGGITAFAAIHHLWSRGMQGTVQATEEQQQALTEQGIAAVLTESEDYAAMAVTDGGVTVKPETVIADEHFVWISFEVSGYYPGEGAEPTFEWTDVYLGEDPEAEDGWLNMGASFYDGIVTDENGSPVYDDGTPLEFGEDGNFISRYEGEDGTLEYVVQAAVADYEASLLGKTMHINLRNLGTVYKAGYTGALEGNWDFTISLPDVSAAEEIGVNKKVEGTAFVLENIAVSPISIRMNYAVDGEVTIYEDENGVPDFCGVVLTDGTRLPYIANGGMTGYTDERMTSAYAINAFNRVIETDQIAAVLVRTAPGAEMMEISLGR